MMICPKSCVLKILNSHLSQYSYGMGLEHNMSNMIKQNSYKIQFKKYTLSWFIQLLEIRENYEMFFQSGKCQGILKFY